MATTKIWAVRSDISSVIDYTKNPDKTVKEINFVTVTDETENGTVERRISDLKDVINYAAKKEKTVSDEGKEVLEFVTGINCNKDTAFKEMMLTKVQFSKTDKVLAWHGYQSFKPGEVTPEQAHEIGIKLAERLWGDRFQVVVTTHLDRAHIHNHFVVNSVSFLDGKKFYGSKATYFQMRAESDALCREYGLSVVENPSYNGIRRGEYQAKKNGRKTKIEIIKDDIEKVIYASASMKDFFRRMKLAGYTAYIRGRSLSVIPYGMEKPIRISRHYPELSPEAIEARIIENREKRKTQGNAYGAGRRYNAGSVKLPRKKLTGYKALYVRYLYLLGKIPDRKRQYKGMHYLIRQDLMYVHKLRNEWNFIKKYNINTTADINTLRKEKNETYDILAEKRNKLQNRIRRAAPDKREELKKELSTLNDEIGKVRKDLYYMKDIEERSVKMTDKIKTVTEIYEGNERSSGKEQAEKNAGKEGGINI